MTKPREASRIEARAKLPTDHGLFDLLLFRHAGELEREHLALVCGNVAGPNVLVRVHSECLTGEIFGSRRCDCGAQLDDAMARIAAQKRGIIVYLRQEGRGIGLANKLRAYALQDQGLDTVEANQALGLPVDSRRYAAAAWLLRALGVASVRLLTNSPDKVEALEALGVSLSAQLPTVFAAHADNGAYLDCKRRRLGHRLPSRHRVA